jgi:Ni,Fe-hydrogenase III component G
MKKEPCKALPEQRRQMHIAYITYNTANLHFNLMQLLIQDSGVNVSLTLKHSVPQETNVFRAIGRVAAAPRMVSRLHFERPQVLHRS